MTQKAEECQLAADGTARIQCIGSNDNDNTTPDCADAGHLNETNRGDVPSAPTTALRPLSELTSKEASPVLLQHLLDVLYGYCLVLRLYNGQYSTDLVGACDVLLTASAVLGQTRPAPSQDSDTCNTVLFASVTSACTPGSSSTIIANTHTTTSSTFQSNSTCTNAACVSRGFAISLLADVAKLLHLGRSCILLALNDASKLLRKGLKELKSSISNIPDSTRKSNLTQYGVIDSKDMRSLDDKRKVDTVLDPSMTKRIQQHKNAVRKVTFMLSWANEMPEELFSVTFMEVDACYKEMKETLVSRYPTEDEKTFLLPKK